MIILWGMSLALLGSAAFLVIQTRPLSRAILGMVVAWIAALVLGLQLLSLLCMMNRDFVPAVMLLSAVVAVAVSASLRRQRETPIAGDKRCWHSVGERRVTFAVLTAYVFIMCASGILGHVAPTFNFDAYAYHLPRAYFWLHAGSMAPLPTLDWRINEFPQVSSLLQATLIAALGPGVEASHLPQLLGCVLLSASAALVVRTMRGDQGIAIVAAVTVGTFPVIAVQLQTAQNDVLLAGLAMSALALAVRWLWIGDRGDLALASAAAGLSAGTKFTAVYLAPGAVLFVLCAVLAAPRDIPVFRRFLMLGVGVLIGFALLGAYAYVQNLSVFGHPFTSEIARADLARTFQRLPPDLVDGFLRYTVEMAQWWGNAPGGYHTYFGLIGGVAFWMTPVAAGLGIWAWRRGDRALLLLFGAALLAWVMIALVAGTRPMTGSKSRYFMPVIAMVVAVGFGAFSRIHVPALRMSFIAIVAGIALLHGMFATFAGAERRNMVAFDWSRVGSGTRSADLFWGGFQMRQLAAIAAASKNNRTVWVATPLGVPIYVPISGLPQRTFVPASPESVATALREGEDIAALAACDSGLDEIERHALGIPGQRDAILVTSRARELLLTVPDAFGLTLISRKGARGEPYAVAADVWGAFGVTQSVFGRWMTTNECRPRNQPDLAGQIPIALRLPTAMLSWEQPSLAVMIRFAEPVPDDATFRVLCGRSDGTSVRRLEAETSGASLYFIIPESCLDLESASQYLVLGADPHQAAKLQITGVRYVEIKESTVASTSAARRYVLSVFSESSDE